MSLCTLLSRPSLHTLVRCVNTRIGDGYSGSRESTRSTVATRHSNSHSSAIHLFFPLLPVVPLSLSPAAARFRLLPFFFLLSSSEFFLLARFYGSSSDARLRASLILLYRIALLCIISIAAGRPEVHIPSPHACRFLIYILDVCVLTRGRINVEESESGGWEEGARRECVDFYFVTPLRTIRTHSRDTYSSCRHYAFHREIYRSIKVEHFDDKSAAIRAGTRGREKRMSRRFGGGFNADKLKFLYRE